MGAGVIVAHLCYVSGVEVKWQARIDCYIERLQLGCNLQCAMSDLHCLDTGSRSELSCCAKMMASNFSVVAVGCCYLNSNSEHCQIHNESTTLLHLTILSTSAVSLINLILCAVSASSFHWRTEGKGKDEGRE